MQPQRSKEQIHPFKSNSLNRRPRTSNTTEARSEAPDRSAHPSPALHPTIPPSQRSPVAFLSAQAPLSNYLPAWLALAH